MSIHQILYIGDLYGVSGYSHTVRNNIISLCQNGAKVFVKNTPFDANVISESREIQLLEQLVSKEAIPESVKFAIHHQFPTDFIPIPHKYNIGFTMFETTPLPQNWVDKCNTMDEIWVPSANNREIFLKSGIVRPVLVVPFGLDIQKFSKRPSRINLDVKAKVIFLSIFQWTERKNWKALLRTFVKTFNSSDDVALIIKTYGSDSSNREQNRISSEMNQFIGQHSSDPPKIVFLSHVMEEKLIPDLYNLSDVFVLPSRGEGIGLPIMEAMACEVPCISTAWGGQTDFLNSQNGFLIRYSMQHVFGMDHIPAYNSNQEWANIDQEHLKQIFKSIYNNPDIVKSKQQHARDIIVNEFNLLKSGQVMLSRLKSLDPLALQFNTLRKKVTYMADIFGISGYANAARGYIMEMAKNNIAIKFEAINHDVLQLPQDSILRQQLNLINKDIDSNILINHQTPDFFNLHLDKYKYKIGVTCFETDKLPKEWVSKCNLMDEIWVFSQHNQKLFIESGVSVPIYVIPHWIDYSRFRPGLRKLEFTNINNFTFLSVFQFSYRKGWDLLIKAYTEEFRHDEPVSLIIKSYIATEQDKDVILKQIKSLIKKTKYPQILLYSKKLDDSMLPHLYNSANVFVLPTRGEAFGLPFLESMACGVPCIATDWGGHTDFISNNNGYLLPYSLKPSKVMPHTPWYRPNMNLAEVNFKALKKTMRQAFNNQKELKRKSKQCRIDVEKFFKTNQIGKKVNERLRTILTKSV